MVVVLAGFAVTEVVRGSRSLMAGFDRGMHAKFEKISEGKSQKLVVTALGEPRAKTDEFNLPQKRGFEHHFDAAKRSSAVEYYQWTNGMNWYYCIGFFRSCGCQRGRSLVKISTPAPWRAGDKPAFPVGVEMA